MHKPLIPIAAVLSLQVAVEAFAASDNDGIWTGNGTAHFGCLRGSFEADATVKGNELNIRIRSKSGVMSKFIRLNGGRFRNERLCSSGQGIYGVEIHGQFSQSGFSGTIRDTWTAREVQLRLTRVAF